MPKSITAETKFKSKCNHDSVWFKITWPNGWTYKFRAGRSGRKYQGTGDFDTTLFEKLIAATKGFMNSSKNQEYAPMFKAIEKISLKSTSPETFVKLLSK